MRYTHIFLIAFLSVVVVNNAYSAASAPNEVVDAIFHESLSAIKTQLGGGGPECFISRAYKQSPELDRKCDAFKNYLKAAGIRTLYDTDDLMFGQSKAAFMEQIGRVEFVVVLFTPHYRTRAQAVDSGVSVETRHLVERLRGVSNFYIPIILEGTAATAIPESLGSRDRLYYDLTDWDNRFELVFQILQGKMLETLSTLPAIQAAFVREKAAINAHKPAMAAISDRLIGEAGTAPASPPPPPPARSPEGAGGAGAIAEEDGAASTTLEEYRRAMAYKLGITNTETALIAGPVEMAAASTTTWTWVDGDTGAGAMPAPPPLKRDSFEPPVASPTADGSKPAAAGVGAVVNVDGSDGALHTAMENKRKVVASASAKAGEDIKLTKLGGSRALSDGEREKCENIRKMYLDVNLPPNAANNFSRKFGYSKLKRCADDGDILAKGYLCLLFSTNQAPTGESAYRLDLYNEAIAALRRDAEGGNPYSQMLLGQLYFVGVNILTDPIPKDPEKAVQWVYTAASQEFPVAQHKLGAMYERGTDVLQDTAKAFEWYKKAALLQYADAQFELGEFYAEGKGGVAKNVKEAAKWYRLAVEQKHLLAKYRLGVIYADGILPSDEDNALGFIIFASDNGYANAQCYIGKLFKSSYVRAANKGKIDKEAKNKALGMLGRAAQQGNAEAKRELAELNALITKEGKCEIM